MTTVKTLSDLVKVFWNVHEGMKPVTFKITDTYEAVTEYGAGSEEVVIRITQRNNKYYVCLNADYIPSEEDEVEFTDIWDMFEGIAYGYDLVTE